MFHPMNFYKLHNGATAADWLGTASVAASVASKLLNDLRLDVSRNVVSDLDATEIHLMQALDEIACVRERLGIPQEPPRVVSR